MDNPLQLPIYSLLASSTKSWKLNELYLALREQGIAIQLDEDDQRHLFKVNFMMMNALYQLSESLVGEQLIIAPLAIQLIPRSGTQAVGTVDGLREYYLDWENYDASRVEVDALLEGFWQRFYREVGSVGGIELDEALSVLGVKPDDSLPVIKRQWRKLALRWHPDRDGGDAEHFRKVCEAWQLLRSAPV